MPPSVAPRFEMHEALVEEHGLEGAQARIADAVEALDKEARWAV